MFEQNHLAAPNEKRFDGKSRELTLNQMSAIITAPEYAFLPPTGYLSSEESLRLATWTKQNGDNLDETLSRPHYQPEAGQLTPADMARLKLSLLTPRFIYAQDERNHTDDPEAKKALIKELAEYNTAMHEAIQANPGMGQEDLMSILWRTIERARLPEPYRRASAKMIQRTIHGVRNQLITEQLARSQTAQAAGMIYGDTSIEDDAMQATDFHLMVPIQEADETLMIPLKVDVKSTREQVTALLSQKEQAQADPKTYKIVGGHIALWPGVSWEELGDALTLDPAIAEEKAARLIPVLQQAARETYDRAHRRGKVEELLGRVSVQDAESA